MLAQQWWQVEGLAALACECQAQFAERRLEIGELGSTVHAKARVIEVPPGPGPLDPRWTLPSFAEKNPLVWDGRGEWSAGRFAAHAPRSPEIAFAKGLIPYIPAHRKDRS